MTGRERLHAIMHRRRIDRLSWTTLVDEATLRILPGDLQGLDAFGFYREIGCDILLLNGWGTAHALLSPELRWSSEITESVRREGDSTIFEWDTPRGKLVAVYRDSHPVKYPIDSWEALRIYREMWENARFIEHDDTSALATLERLIGDDGMVMRFWGPSTIPLLLENQMGIEQFYYLLADYKSDMEELIGCIHAHELEAFRILAEGPCEVVTLCENTSTLYISPEIYKRYNFAHQRDFVEIIHSSGKVALLHMCGHVARLLPQIKQTGTDGIHALTPPPTGDTPWETALDVLGEDSIIIGVLDPAIFSFAPLDQIGETLDRLYSPRLRRASFCLSLGADGIAVPLERFRAVGDWMRRRGHVTSRDES